MLLFMFLSQEVTRLYIGQFKRRNGLAYFFNGLGDGFLQELFSNYFSREDLKLFPQRCNVLMGWLIVFYFQDLTAIYMKRSILPNSWWSFIYRLVLFYTALRK